MGLTTVLGTGVLAKTVSGTGLKKSLSFEYGGNSCNSLKKSVKVSFSEHL